MRILALQLKRIGDLILTTPALRALRDAWPEAHLALGVSSGCASLLGAIETVDSGIVFGRGRGFAPWQQVLTGPWDLCLDFTGNDRSALATFLSRAKVRATFTWVERNRLRVLAYHRFVDSPVRERHTADHYLDLASVALEAAASREINPELRVPAEARSSADKLLQELGVARPFALLHPGTARPEKYWLPERWAQLADHLATERGLDIVLTCGPDEFERDHVRAIQAKLQNPKSKIAHPADLLVLDSLVAEAQVVVSCDTAVVHFAAAARVPQVALFGPTNPFHWRPRHPRALVVSAAQPEAPLTDFAPRMKGGPMERISTATVIRATDALLRDHQK